MLWVAVPQGFLRLLRQRGTGKKVVLIEQSGTFGGASSLAMVAEIMNFDDGKNFICNGFGREVYEKLGLVNTKKREWYNVKYESLKRVYDDLVISAGVEVFFYTRVVDVISKNGKVLYAIISGPNGVCAVKGKFFIDCTGSGSLACFAGAEYVYGDDKSKTMSATVCSLWGGVDFFRKPYDSKFYEQAYNDGVFSQYDNVLLGIKGNYVKIGVGGGNVGHCFGVDSRDIKSLTKAMFDARKLLKEYENYYKNYVPGCENAVLIKSADFIGIREDRRIICEYMLTQDNFFVKEAFYDEIGRYSYPIDIHPITPDKVGMKGFKNAISIRHEDGESYSIPYRCLVPKRVDNLLVAGRSIGTDQAMQASTRGIPCCYITGQAAGAAAAVCVEENTSAKKVDVEKVKVYIKYAYADRSFSSK